MVSPCRTERDRTCALAMAAGPVSFSKPSGRWRGAARGDGRTLIPICAPNPDLTAWVAVLGVPDVNHVRLVAPPTRAPEVRRPTQIALGVPPFASRPNFHKRLIYLLFLWKKILPFSGTKEYLGRYPRQVGVRPGLTEGFSTHGRISRSRDIYSAAQLCIPRAARERLRYRFARGPRRRSESTGRSRVPSATSWLTSRRWRRRHGAAMTAPLRS
jgi:hypothetical protein